MDDLLTRDDAIALLRDMTTAQLTLLIAIDTLDRAYDGGDVIWGAAIHRALDDASATRVHHNIYGQLNALSERELIGIEKINGKYDCEITERGRALLFQTVDIIEQGLDIRE